METIKESFFKNTLNIDYEQVKKNEKRVKDNESRIIINQKVLSEEMSGTDSGSEELIEQV